MANFVQFQLWRDCSCNCDFCMNKNIADMISKEQALSYYLSIINNKEIDKYDQIGIIGGEFFNKELKNPKVKALFYQFQDSVINKITTGIVTKFYLASSLLFKDLSEICSYLDRFDTLISKVLLCTSYDTKYRFKNNQAEALWKKNLSYLQSKYKSLRIHVEIIVTQDFIQKVLNNQFNVSDFENKYKVKVDFIEPSVNYTCTKEQFIKILPDFLPKREAFLAFLKKGLLEKQFSLDEFFNPKLHANTIYMHLNNKFIKIDNRCYKYEDLANDIIKMLGRQVEYMSYADSQIKMSKDISILKELQ